MRHAISIILISWILMSSACLAKEHPPQRSPVPLASDNQNVCLEGRLEQAGPSIYMEGSHELLDPQGGLLARLSGFKYRVDLPRYEGQWVKVTGQWKPTVESGGQILEVMDVEPPESVPPRP